MLDTPFPPISFWRHVEPQANGCWAWTGSTNQAGYARWFHKPYGTAYPHRITYLSMVGPICEGREIDHLCRNRACVNPDHLEVVTHYVNGKRNCQRAMLTCKWGHLFAGPNLVIYHRPDGRTWRRFCRACLRRNARVTAANRKARQDAALSTKE